MAVTGVPSTRNRCPSGRLAINRHEVLLEELESELRRIFAQRADKTMFIDGARPARPHGAR